MKHVADAAQLELRGGRVIELLKQLQAALSFTYDAQASDMVIT